MEKVKECSCHLKGNVMFYFSPKLVLLLLLICFLAPITSALAEIVITHTPMVGPTHLHTLIYTFSHSS